MEPIGVSLRSRVSLLNFMDSDQVHDVLNSARQIDVTAAVQAAIDWSDANRRAMHVPSGGYLCGNITTRPVTALLGDGRHKANFWCAPGTAGKWWSDRGCGAQKLTMHGMAFYGQNEPALTHIAEFGCENKAGQYGTEGNLSQLWMRDAPNAVGLELDADVGLLSDITVQSLDKGLVVMGACNQGRDLISVRTRTAGMALASGHWRGLEIEAPASGSIPLHLLSSGTHVTGATVSLAPNTDIEAAVDLHLEAYNEWSVSGLRVIVGDGATLGANFRQNGKTWNGVQGFNSGQASILRLKVGPGPDAAPIHGILKRVVQLDFPPVAPGGEAIINVDVEGAFANMPALLGLPISGAYGSLQYSAHCPGGNKVAVRVYNAGREFVDPPLQTFVVVVLTYA